VTGEGILVAGIGNILLGDDGFGVEVVRRLRERGALPGASVIDFGIRGQDLALALVDGWRAVIMVDAARRGGPPGTLYLLEPSIDGADATPAMLATHGMDPVQVLSAARREHDAPVVRILACEPEVVPGDDEDLVMGLSGPVQAAIEPACAMLERLVGQLREEAAHA
jgi:hydrogenase maturation protease